MYGIEELEIARLHREEVARGVRLGRMSGARRSIGGSGVIRVLGRNFSRFLKLFQTARNVG